MNRKPMDMLDCLELGQAAHRGFSEHAVTVRSAFRRFDEISFERQAHLTSLKSRKRGKKGEMTEAQSSTAF